MMTYISLLEIKCVKHTKSGVLLQYLLPHLEKCVYKSHHILVFIAHPQDAGVLYTPHYGCFVTEVSTAHYSPMCFGHCSTPGIYITLKKPALFKQAIK